MNTYRIKYEYRERGAIGAPSVNEATFSASEAYSAVEHLRSDIYNEGCEHIHILKVWRVVEIDPHAPNGEMLVDMEPLGYLGAV